MAPQFVSADADSAVLAAVAHRIRQTSHRLVLAAADEVVSAPTTTQFAAHAGVYQAVSVQATAIHQLFATTLRAGAWSYAVIDAANVVPTS
jgi:hypothetical protein